MKTRAAVLREVGAEWSVEEIELDEPKAGEILVKQLQRQSAQKIEVTSLGSEREEAVLDAGDVDWMVRVIWASQ